MAITTRDGLVAAALAAQQVTYRKTASRTTVAATWFSLFDLAGSPTAGTLAGASTAAGIVPTDATVGCPLINAFGGGATGYITGIDFGCTVPARIAIYDMLFKAGAYTFSSNVTLASQPSYASRVPGGDYKGCEIWLEAVTAFTGNQSIQITYQDQDNNASDTGVVATGVAPTVGRLFPVPLASGDSGVQRINSVISTVSSAGTFNVLVLRRLATVRVNLANGGDTYGPDRVGGVQLYADSALYAMISTDATSSGVPDLLIDVANG